MTEKIKILYLEDEHFLGRIVKESLSSRNYNIELINDGALFMNSFMSFKPDICVLDIMVPNVDGYSIAKEIKMLHADIPIIFLSAKNQTEDVIKGFHSGGNDYLKKPFSMEELIVRIDNLLNLKIGNTKEFIDEVVPLGKYLFDYNKFQLRLGEEHIALSHRENELLRLLVKNLNVKVDRKVILKTLWGDDSFYNSRNLDVYIRKLRIYFEKDSSIKLTTLRGVGYHLAIN